MSRFLDLHRLRTAPPDERIAALRRLREQSRAHPGETETVNSDEVAEGAGSRSRITNRLRDRFRIGTRQQPSGAAVETPQSNTTVTEETRTDTPR